MSTDISTLEGWLLKKKTNKKLFSSSDVKRWFKVEIVPGDDSQELALCYYQNKQSKECKGWIFLSDITEINEEVGIFTIVSPLRTMALEAQTRAEHRHWINGLTGLCPQALINGVAQQKESVSPMTIGSKSSDKFARPGSGSRPNSSDSAAAIDGSDRIGPGKSGRHHNFDEDKSETLLRRSNDSFRDNDRELEDDRRGRRNSRERSREGRERGDESDRGRDSSSERNTRYREDHRLRNERSELSPHEATASARMHGHISRGEQVDNERSRTERPSSRPPSNENESYSKGRTSTDAIDQGDDLEALDINKPAQPSREARLQDRKERLRSGSMENQPNAQEEHKEAPKIDNPPEISESKTQDKKIRAPSGPRPAPRRAADLQDDDDSDGNLSDSNRKDFSRPLASSEIDELRPGALTVNLDDSDDDGGEMDFKAEKRRYGSHGNDEKSSGNDGTGSRPPRPPPNKPQAKQESRQSNTSKGPSKDANFVTEDWDDDNDDEPAPSRRTKSKSIDKQRGPVSIQTGPKADSNWLHEDFDD